MSVRVENIGWSVQYLIAGTVVKVESDSKACKEDMHKFLCLYQRVTSNDIDLTFSVMQQGDSYNFVFTNKAGEQDQLWFSSDEREISAALEIHFYSQLIQYLDPVIISMHAAALNVGDSACLFAGVSGAGKSSICTAGLLAGAKYLSDEFALLDVNGAMHPFPRPMQWEFPTHPAFDREMIQQSGLICADYFDFPDVSGDIVRCHLWHPTHVQREPLKLTCVVLHQYNGKLEKAELTAIPRHEALIELPQHLHVQRGMAKDLPMLNQRIDKGCHFYRLKFPNVFEAWALIEKEMFKLSSENV